MLLWIFIFTITNNLYGCELVNPTPEQQLRNFNETLYRHIFDSQHIASYEQVFQPEDETNTNYYDEGFQFEDDMLEEVSKVREQTKVKSLGRRLNGSYIAKKLQAMTQGDVFSREDPEYEYARAVHNGGCHARPMLVVVPLGERDVSAGVVFARRMGLEVSVRSGGHSYTCTSIREGGIHFDMRKMNKIEMVNRVRENYLAVKLGPGSTWRRVLDEVPPTKFTMIHGQCTSVGVGGYLLGGGVNLIGTTNKYGFGAEHVLEYKIVTAVGDIATVEEDKTTIMRIKESARRSWRATELVKEVVMHNEDNDLMFALRGAGSSFGIVTEFLYKIYPGPETLPIYLIVWVDSVKALLNLQEAAFNPHFPYNIVINHAYYFTGGIFSFPGGILNLFYKLLKFTRTGNPLVLQITDLSKNAPTQTDIHKTIAFLERYDVEIVFRNYVFINYFSKMCFKGFGLLSDYEHIYMETSEAKNCQKIASANIAGLKNITEIASYLLLNPMLDVKGKHKDGITTGFGCDFCFWVIVFTSTAQREETNIRRQKILSLNPKMYQKNTISTELSCMFKDYNGNKGCPAMVKRVKNNFFKTQRKLGRSVIQYGNTPTCDKEHFGEKYWGSNYQKLVKIKEFWDPNNVFNHCQSVGSDNVDCCPKY